MADGHLEPALTADAWRRWRGYPIRARTLTAERVTEITSQDIAGSIALLNDLLPRDDARKIKPEWVAWLRDQVTNLKRAKDRSGAAMAAEIADALEAYLEPPANETSTS